MRNLSTWALLVLAVQTLFGSTTFAQETTERWFAQMSDTCVDWEAVGSKRIVARNNNEPEVVEEFGSFDLFGGGSYVPSDFIVYDEDGEILLDLQGTKWVRIPIIHITDEGVEEYRQILWYQDEDLAPPKPGLTSKTGPDGDVFFITSFRYDRISDGNGSNSNKLRIVQGSGGLGTICLSYGFFNK